MGAEAHKQAVEHALSLFNAHDPSYFGVYTEDVASHGFPPDVPPNLDGLKGLFTQMWSSFPDLRAELVRLIAEDDVAAVQLRVGGTHEGEFIGAEPTGKRVEVEVMAFLRFAADGRIAERWTRMDDVAFLTQLGLMPAPAAAPA